jgi:hypothetical protein
MQVSKEDVMMRSILRHAQWNVPAREAVVSRAKAAARSLRPLAFAYLADRVYGG